MVLGKRIMILGSAGSGKSTLAIKLSGITGIPATHLDRLFWNPGWVQTPSDEMDGKVIEAASGDEWIIDGNYSRTMDFRFERADTVIFIDLNRYVCIYSVLKRWIMNYGRTRYDLGEGCTEKIDIQFLSWVWNYPKRSRKKTLEKIELFSKGENKMAYRLRSRREAEAFIRRIESLVK